MKLFSKERHHRTVAATASAGSTVEFRAARARIAAAYEELKFSTLTSIGTKAEGDERKAAGSLAGPGVVDIVE